MKKIAFIDRDGTLIWEPEEYIVNLDMNDGNSSTKAIPKISTIAVTYDKKYSYNDVFTKLTNNAPTRPGYEFKGWTKTEVCAGFDSTIVAPKVFDLLGSAESYSVSNYIDPNDNMLSFFARANYDYKSRYYISLTFRADGSSRFSVEIAFLVWYSRKQPGEIRLSLS